MKKRNKLMALWMMCLILISSITFTACNEDEELDTNQMGSSEVTLKSFGPSPAMRGGELRFIGTNLDKVQSIDIPGAEGITEITKVSKYEIRIAIPQSAEPGYVTLNTAADKITSLTPIGYSEPITISGFSPKSAKAGATIKIEGDYLNIVEEVIFADGVHVLKADFVSQSREELEVKIPSEAQTGKIIVSDGADILSDGEYIPTWIYTEEEITLTLPTIEALNPNPVKAGESLTIKGKDFDLVAKVILPGGAEIEVSDATTQIVIEATPADIKEGTVTLVAKSGIEVLSSELKLVKPAISGVSATNVKNGEAFTINGSDLDLVTEVTFQGASVAAEEFISASESSIELVLPAIANTGVFTLNTASETSTEGESLTFAVPAVTGINPDAVKAKESITISGSNLDVVEKVIFGAVEGTIEVVTETEMTVTVPIGAVNGAITLVTLNGTEVVTTQEITINVTLPEITSITSEGPGGIITVEGIDLSLIKTIYLADADGEYTIPVTDYGTKSDTYLEFYHVEGSAKGDITPLMITVDGDEGYMPEVYCGGVDPITEATEMIMDFNVREESDWHGLDWDNWGGSYDQDVCKPLGYVILLSNPGWWIVGCNHPDPNGGWPGVNSADYVLKIDIKTETPITVNDGFSIATYIGGNAVEIPLPVKGGVIDTKGDWITIQMDISGLPNPTPASGDYGIICNNAADMDWAGLSFDNMRYDPK
ncbi:MAG: IPT/TIG domain-containing protein [Prolixibacteraceae bacterium]|jgi:hypothetical protein|nr:IPT/TIG domain-containing protein [Prolixibacteraceae bacterium]